MTFHLRIRIEGDDEVWPGPRWEPVVYDGIYPLIHEPGDIYINRYREPPLYYIFTRKDNCDLITREEIKEWVQSGLMKVSPLIPPSSQPKKLSQKHGRFLEGQ